MPGRAAAENERFLNIKDLCDRYGVVEQTVYHWNHKGTGPRYVRVGRLVRYRLSDVVEWENSRVAGGVEGA